MQRGVILGKRYSSVLLQTCGCSSKAPLDKNEGLAKIETKPPTKIKHDWIGPPDESSNIRPIKFVETDDETANEKRYRRMHQQLLKWNQEHWGNHNKKFFKAKEEFVKRTLKEKTEQDGDKAEKTLTPEEMSIFYKKFLDEHYSMHITYNKEWYKRNLALLWPAFLAFLDRRKRTWTS